MMAWLQPSPAIVAHLTQPVTIDMASETLLSLAGPSKRGVSLRLLVPEAAALLQRSNQVRCQSTGRDPAIDGPRGVPRVRNGRAARGRFLGDRRKYRKSRGENDDIQRMHHHHHFLYSGQFGHHRYHHLNMPVLLYQKIPPAFLQKSCSPRSQQFAWELSRSLSNSRHGFVTVAHFFRLGLFQW